MAFGYLLLHPRLGLALIGALLCGAFISITPAYADLRVCNQTADQVSIALGYRAERGWQSEGWWVADPQQCAVVYQGDLHSRFFYLYVADDIGGGAWDGSVLMCTRDESFTIFGIEDCLARGYERTGFFEVDTQNKADWTLQLTENRDEQNGTDADTPSVDQPEGTPDDSGVDNPPPGDAPPNAPDAPAAK
ncbi:MAG TPA: DUF1036 domain-containing protein [Devosiaceae bacterium]